MNTITTEEWRDIPGYENYYQVSDLGRVRSLDRTVPYRGSSTKTLKGKVLKLTPDKDGYLNVSLSKNNAIKRAKVHGLVMTAFVGPYPQGMEVLHDDDDKTNNQLSNLSYGTHKANMNTPAMSKVGENHNGAILTEASVRALRFIRSVSKISYKELGDMFGLNGATIHAAVTGTNWKHI